LPAQLFEWRLLDLLSQLWIPHVCPLSSYAIRSIVIPTNFHLLDYQVTSNSWTFLEANVAIIVACLPTLQGLIIRLLPCIDPYSKSSTTDYSEGFARDNYTPKTTILSHGRSRIGANQSDEEFILHNIEPVKFGVMANSEIAVQDIKRMDVAVLERQPLSPPLKY
jgi:hypothetical protein